MRTAVSRAKTVGRRAVGGSSVVGLVALKALDFDLEQTLSCGQVFHWVREGSGWLGAIDDAPVYAEQRGSDLLVSAKHAAMAARYFALDHPLGEITASFPNDPAMEQAALFCRGLRIIRQPHWECLATFITSSMKQVAHIAQISHTLRQRFGQPIDWNGRALYGYPSPEKLAALDESVLRDCRLGYRAKNLLATARRIASGEFDLGAVERLDDAAAREALCRLPGVGVKVANCVLLFAYERIRAFPIDVWIERVLREKYFKGKRSVTSRRLREFSERYFGAYGGYAQQYLFHHARKTSRGRGDQPAAK